MAKTNSSTETRKVDELAPWDKNPRGINKDDFERLKRQITNLGIYKPLLINKDNVVLGGNMRLKAYQDLGIEEVEVSVVDAQTPKRMLEYALSDNDRAGYYEDQQLAELVASVPDIDLGDYKVDMGKPISIGELLQQLGPGDVNNTNQEIDTDILGEDLDIECPKCHFRFTKNVQL